MNENDEEYSKDNKTFMLELYKENRQLLEEVSMLKKNVIKIENENVYLKNSNLFWMCCYFGTAFTTYLAMNIF